MGVGTIHSVDLHYCRDRKGKIFLYADESTLFKICSVGIQDNRCAIKTYHRDEGFNELNKTIKVTPDLVRLSDHDMDEDFLAEALLMGL